MREANQLHAVCLDTLPAIFYIDETSKLIVNAVRDLNANETVAGYSIDAGNHVFVFCKSDQKESVKQSILGKVGSDKIEKVIATSIDRAGVE